MKKKDDLNQPLTKGDFLEFLGETGRFGKLESKVDTLEARFDRSMRIINERFDRIESQMFTKEDWRKDWDKLMVIVDRVMGETEESRQQRLFSGEQYTRIEDTVRDHGKRIAVLEKAGV